MIFLDFEASSLSNNSYPIEVGWCDHALTRGWSAIIRPHPDMWGDWSPAAEAIHGLSRERIERDGMPLAEVMAKLNADLAGEEVISDNPGHEAMWLGELARAAGIKPLFQVSAEVDFHGVLTAAQQQTGSLDILLAKLLRRDAGVRPHRALDDAIDHALQLGMSAVMALNDQHGADAAGQFRERLVRSAKRLLELHGRDAFLARTARFVAANDEALKANTKAVLDGMKEDRDVD